MNLLILDHLPLIKQFIRFNDIHILISFMFMDVTESNLVDSIFTDTCSHCQFNQHMLLFPIM
ncbi:hypothetical protein A9X05_09240 [Mycobacterium sp. E3298]|nr:hypothetical protein A9X05_09240 [Mycobacterium sp. E3298]